MLPLLEEASRWGRGWDWLAGWLDGWLDCWSGRRLGHVLGNLPRTSSRAGLGRAGGGGGQKGPKGLKMVHFALLANFSHFGAKSAKIINFSSKTHFLHFWPPKVAKYHYVYKPFCPVVQKVRSSSIFSFLTKFCTFRTQNAKKWLLRPKCALAPWGLHYHASHSKKTQGRACQFLITFTKMIILYKSMFLYFQQNSKVASRQNFCTKSEPSARTHETLL